MSEKGLKLLTVIAGTFLATAILLLIVDYQLKNAIIVEAKRLQEVIGGKGNEGSDSLRNSGNDSRDGPFPSDLVDSGNAGMEAKGSNGAPKAKGHSTGRSLSTGKNTDSQVYGGSE